MESEVQERFTPGELFQAGDDGVRRAAIVTNLLDEDGRYGELVEIPGGERFAISRRALARDWRPFPCDGPWYVEQHSAGGRKLDWGAHVPSLEFVLAIAKCALHRRAGEVIRFRTRDYISDIDLARLRFLNTTRLP